MNGTEVTTDSLSRAEALRKELGRLLSHDRSLEKLCEIVSVCPLYPTEAGMAPGQPEVLYPGDVGTARKLAAEVRKRMVDDDNKVKIRQYQRDLSFGSPYQKITVASIAFCLAEMAEETEFDVELPMHISGDCLFESNRFYDALSQFGPSAFSLFNSRGESFKIPREVKPSDPVFRYKDEDGKIHKPRIYRLPFAYKPLQTCVDEFTKIFQNRVISINQKEVAAKSRCFVVEDKEDIEGLWRHMSATIGQVKKGKNKPKGTDKPSAMATDEDGNREEGELDKLIAQMTAKKGKGQVASTSKGVRFSE